MNRTQKIGMAIGFFFVFKEIMLKGTASRILFGDPAFVPTPAFTDQPFDVEVDVKPDKLGITAVLRNDRLKSTYTDTYHSGMSRTRQFNDRALVTAEMPD